MIEYTFYYLIVINLLSFIAFALDKRKAVKHKYRIPERWLFLLSILGGSPAALAAMQIFHHKTRKPAFRFGIPLILFVQLIIGFYILI